MAYPFGPKESIKISNDVKKPKKDKKHISAKIYLNKSHTHRNNPQK